MDGAQLCGFIRQEPVSYDSCVTVETCGGFPPCIGAVLGNMCQLVASAISSKPSEIVVDGHK